MTASLVCLSLLSSAATPPPNGDWLYIGEGVRIVSFEVTMDKPGDKDAFVPGHRSGFIVLRGDGFSISSASLVGATYVTYEHGVLKRTQASDFWKGGEPTKSESSMPYKEALLTSLEESVGQELKGVAEEILSKGTRDPLPPPNMETRWGNVEYGGDWRALKRITQVLGIRIDYVFKRILPKPRGKEDPPRPKIPPIGSQNAS